MASTKHAIDFSDFASPRQANKLTANSVRKALEYDAYAGKNHFIALVLANPTRHTTDEASLETGAPQPTTADKAREFAGVEGTRKKIGKISFRARILGPNSPHAFIPNPCESLEFAEATLGDEYEQVRMKLISMHTIFYSREDFSIGAGLGYPSAGQLVEVFLDKGDDGSFDLQKGRYEGTIVSAEDAKQTIANFDIPWALTGGGAKYAYNNPVRKGEAIPQWALNKVGMPFKGNFPITSPWGPPGSIRGLRGRRHGGTDFDTPSGTEILAIADGQVVDASVSGKGPGDGFGGRVRIKHKNKDYLKDPNKVVYSVYAHLQTWTSSKNVKAGDVIGISGGGSNDPNAGSSTGPHLHLEVWVGGRSTKGGTKTDAYGQGPPVTETQNATTGYTVPFFDWYTDNARALGIPGVPQPAPPPKQSIGVNSDEEFESTSAEADRDRAQEQELASATSMLSSMP
tara:strand:- start:248 stop:1618 length:1371 start_codon:yes stop_codon:yes gene_type:complete